MARSYRCPPLSTRPTSPASRCSARGGAESCPQTHGATWNETSSHQRRKEDPWDARAVNAAESTSLVPPNPASPVSIILVFLVFEYPHFLAGCNVDDGRFEPLVYGVLDVHPLAYVPLGIPGTGGWGGGYKGVQG
eukprot:CAMPEP_0118671164 /NCGR_PEP_ID=MMETSP0785-20121206/21856_1 /TAXON_ID=91992 /ORGANISM="Bolidomonas pacifica, Strain CCMP 1866" /LENGTH=134 /DNA_ID=CAMNT_0006566031 /DNA_START=581 /DNA_END=986 /DNA_ORIENTATION=-